MNRSSATLLAVCLALVTPAVSAQSSVTPWLRPSTTADPSTTASDTTTEANTDSTARSAPERQPAPAPEPVAAPEPAGPAEAAKVTTEEALAPANEVSESADDEGFGFDTPGRWQITVMPYAWLPWIDGGLAGDAKVHLDPGDILDDLQATAQGSLMARKDNSPWGFFLDFIYFNLHDNGNDLKFKSEFLTAMVTYALAVKNEKLAVDLMAGARYVSLRVDVGDGPVGGSVDWIDPLLGIKSTYQLSDKWSLRGYADGGVFDVGDASKFTYQTMATVQYDFNDKLQGMAGFRYLNIYQKQAIDFDGDIYGPIMGLKINL